MERNEHFRKAAHILVTDLAEQLKMYPEIRTTRNFDSNLYKNFLYMGISLLDFMVIAIKARNIKAEHDAFYPRLYHSDAEGILEYALRAYGKPQVKFDRALFLENNIGFTWVKDEVICPVLWTKSMLAIVTPLFPAPQPSKPKLKHNFRVIPGGKDDPN